MQKVHALDRFYLTENEKNYQILSVTTIFKEIIKQIDLN